MGKWMTGIIYLLTGGLVGIGLLYDLWTLNGQVSEMNRRGSTGGRRASKETTGVSRLEFCEYNVKCFVGVTVGYILYKAFPQ